MYKSLLILPLLLLTVQAGGKFSVLEHPISLDFKGTNKLDSTYLGDVLGASLGLYVNTDSKWEAFYIINPFELPKAEINVLVEGISELHLNKKAKSFSLIGSNTQDSINMISSTLEALNTPTMDVDLNMGIDSLLIYVDILGNLEIPITPKSTGNLKPDVYPEDKLFLQQIAAINALSNKISEIQNKPTLINIRLSLTQLINTHEANSAVISEVMKTLSETILNFSEKSRDAYKNQLLFTVVTDDNLDISSRIKRQATGTTVRPSNFRELNLAKDYGSNYPVIFNIILWLMVVFVISLIAISYVIGTMDPGRDSIIYRMTSTRMKKDN